MTTAAVAIFRHVRSAFEAVVLRTEVPTTIFKWRQTAPELILCAVRWYLRYSLSLRDVEELLTERGLEADDTTIWRWVQR